MLPSEGTGLFSGCRREDRIPASVTAGPADTAGLVTSTPTNDLKEFTEAPTSPPPHALLLPWKHPVTSAWVEWTQLLPLPSEGTE